MGKINEKVGNLKVIQLGTVRRKQKKKSLLVEKYKNRKIKGIILQLGIQINMLCNDNFSGFEKVTNR